MIAIADYGVGNIFSLYSSFEYIGAKVRLTDNPEVLKEADKIVLPGVGAFGDAVNKLKSGRLYEAVLREAQSGKPLLGICLGMQLLFEKSFEYGEHDGFGLIKGEIAPIKDDVPSDLKIPHMGWNSLEFPKDRERSPIFKYLDEGEQVYFVHSFYAKNCNDSVTATANYGIDITAAVQRDNVYATQFHPEKSGETGLKILKAFTEL